VPGACAPVGQALDHMLTWIVLLALAAFSAGTYALGRRRALAAAEGRPATLHSLPGYAGGYVALWAGVPALILLSLFLIFGGRLETALLSADLPPAAQQLPPEQRELFIRDAQALAEGRQRSEAGYSPDVEAALEQKATQAEGLKAAIDFGLIALVFVLATAGALLAYRRLGRAFRARNRVEGWISGVLIACSVVAVLTTVGIVASLLFESARFFGAVSPLEFLFGTDWAPQGAFRADQAGGEGQFGAVPLFVGTFLIMLIAMAVAGPIGLYSAIYLSEYAGPNTRAWVKPALEILAGVPTVVYGFFAALTVGPALRSAINGLGELIGGPLGLYLSQVQNQMALVAGLVMGIMLIPFVSSLSDDIINAVPQSLRDGSYAMGATKSETVQKVVLPAALPGIAGAFLLAISRAVGETMIVTMAAGLQANLTVNPLETVTTVTVQIVTLLTGDQEFDSPRTLAAFGLGLTLFVVTLALNIIALRIVQRYREQYD
jgi:phosphate transport system permease protein